MGLTLADELVAMAEAQFAAQTPLAALLERDGPFAEWAVSARPTLIAADWSAGQLPDELRFLWDLHDRHDLRLRQVIDEYGWPGRSLVGEDGADAAWVVAQHADRHQHLRRQWLALLERAVGSLEADPRHFARLADRVALLDQQPQPFGTYARRLDDGRIEFDPPARGSIADVDRRRAALGLPHLSADLAEPPDAAPYRHLRKTPAFRWPARRDN